MSLHVNDLELEAECHSLRRKPPTTNTCKGRTTSGARARCTFERLQNVTLPSVLTTYVDVMKCRWFSPSQHWYLRAGNPEGRPSTKFTAKTTSHVNHHQQFRIVELMGSYELLELKMSWQWPRFVQADTGYNNIPLKIIWSWKRLLLAANCRAPRAGTVISLPWTLFPAQEILPIPNDPSSSSLHFQLERYPF